MQSPPQNPILDAVPRNLMVAHAAERREVFRRKRDLLLGCLRRRGLECGSAEATLYLWVRAPPRHSSISYALALLEEGIVVSPGTAFGAGEGYVRVSLVPDEGECREAVERWERVT